MPYDLVVGAVAHEAYRGFSAADLAELVNGKGIIADLKGMWRSP
jgi:UDP-N-acetyl-D-mannosaminuronate dehydrogenase